MKQLNILTDGALLIHNGVIHDVGPSRRIENLANARGAEEVDASGRIVMPSFADPDGVLVFPPAPSHPNSADPMSQRRIALRVLSPRVLTAGALAASFDYVRLGVLTVGAHTGYAPTLKESVKVLLVQASLKDRALRIRSVFAPPLSATADHARWFPTLRRRNLVAIVEFSAGEKEGQMRTEQIKAAALAAADHGFAIRIRCEDPAKDCLHELACQAGAIAWIGLPPRTPLVGKEFSGVYVIPASDSLSANFDVRESVRQCIDEGVPLALASHYGLEGPRSANPQLSLYLAVRHFGFTIEEALMASTYNAACSLKTSHVTGSLEPEKSADLLIMDVPDYRELFRRVGHSDVFQVLRRGASVYRRGDVDSPSRYKLKPSLS